MQVIGDLIWVFGSAGDAAEAESQKIATSAVPELTDGSSFHFPWFVRDLPYDASVLLENVSPSETLPNHASFAAFHDLWLQSDRSSRAITIMARPQIWL